jgi:methionine sulfoxide reductase heme-binding subunit
MTNAAWYAARGTGVVALIMLSIVMVLGIGSRSGRPAFGLPRFAVNLVHRNASLLAVVLLAIHVGTLLIDPYAQLHLVDVVVPFAAPYRTAWVGFGTVALDLIVALVVTSLLRARIGQRTWQVLHWLAYAAWPVAWIHGIGAGTDRGSAWYLAIAALCAASVLATVAWRCTSGFTTLGGQRLPRQIRDVLLRDERAVITTYRGGDR